MKTLNEINVEQKLSLEDFCTLFMQLPLNENEINELSNYYKMYELFISSNVFPKDSWVAIRNMYIIKNQQILDRIKS